MLPRFAEDMVLQMSLAKHEGRTRGTPVMLVREYVCIIPHTDEGWDLTMGSVIEFTPQYVGQLASCPDHSGSFRPKRIEAFYCCTRIPLPLVAELLCLM